MGVVLVVGGYFGSYNKGDEIIGFEDVVKLDGKVFYVGIVFEDGKVVIVGGCVLCVIVLGYNVIEV